jgi:hypothetical protein
VADYDAGRAFLQIVPSFRGVRESIKKQAKTWADDVEGAVEKALPEGFTKGSKATEPVAKKKGTETGEAYGGAFARTVKTRVEAALKALPPVKINADSSLVDIKLAAIRAELADLSKQKIGVDVDDATALAQLERLKAELDQIGADSASIQVRADTATASVELDKLAAQIRRIADDSPTVQVDADTGAADAKLAATGAEAARLGASSPTISPDVDSGRALIGIAVIRAALLALTAAPIVIPIAVAGASLLGPLAAAGAGAAGFGAVAASGLSRIHTAMQAQDADTGGGGRSAASQVSATNSIRLAQLGLADAQRAVAVTARQNAQAQAQAAEQVRAAEQSLAQAQRQAADAQKALNQARVDAKRGLEDLANSLADAQLAQRRAQANLRDAQATLTAVLGDPRSTAAQREAAQLAVDEATQALAEQGQAVKRFAEDKKAADKAGVSGSDRVLAAERRLADARREAADRQRALSKARAEQASVELQNAERNIQAQEGLVRAQLGLASAQASAAAAQESAAGATSKLDKAMKDLTPTERAALGAFRDFGQAYRDWVSALEPAVFPAILGGLDLIKSLFKPLTPIVQAASGAFVQLEKDAQKALTSPFWKDTLAALARLTGPAILAFGHVVGNVITGIAGIGRALSPTGGGVLRSIEGLSEKFATFGKNANKPGGFQDFLHWVRENLPRAIEWLKAVGEALLRIGRALLPIGGLVLGGIKLLADVINAMPPSLLGAIAAAIIAVAAAVKLWALATKALVFFEALLNLELGPIIIIIFGLAAAFLYAWTQSERFRDIVIGALLYVRDTAFGAGRLTAKYIIDPILGLIALLRTAWANIKTVFATGWATVKTVFADVSGFFQKYFIGPIEAIPAAAKRIWDGIKKVFYSGVNAVIDIINGFIGAFNFFFSKFAPTQRIHFDLIQHVGQKTSGKGFGLAGGGVLPGYAPGVDSIPAMLSPGEGVLVPEAVRALGADWILGINAAFSRRRPGTNGAYAGGGVVGDFLSLLPSPTSVLPGVSGKSLVSGPAERMQAQLRHGGDLPGRVGGAVAGRLADAVAAALDKSINLLPAVMAGLTGCAAPAGGAVSRWSGVAGQALTQLGQSTTLINPVLQLIKFESGGNPTAVNRTDINWQHGTPSVGLAQVIGPTFAGNAGPYLGTGPFLYGVSTNPLANVFAGLNYGIRRYGSVSNIPGIRSVQHGGPYLPYDQGGYLPPGMSAVFNGTGRPEPVLSGAQWETLAGSTRGGDGPMTISGTLDLGDGLVGRVEGIIDAREHQQARQVSYGRRAVAV